MSERRIGYFSPDQARDILDTVRQVRALGLLSRPSQVARPVESPQWPVWVKNTETSLAVPAFGCMEVFGVENVGDLTYVKIRRPTVTDGVYLFNYDTEIEASGLGMSTPWGLVRMLGDGNAVTAMTRYGPVVNQWYIEQTDGGPFEVFGEDNTADNILRGRSADGSSAKVWAGKADASGISARSGTTPGSGTVALYIRNTSTNTLEATGDSETVYNISATAVGADAYVIIAYDAEEVPWVIVESCV